MIDFGCQTRRRAAADLARNPPVDLPIPDRPRQQLWRPARWAGPSRNALTVQINQLTADLSALVAALAPSLLEIPGCAALTVAKIIGETTGVDRFRSTDAYARHTGTSPMPVWSANKARRRLSRTENRQLNAALHRLALTQAHWHEPAKVMIRRRKAGGDSGLEALRVLKRRLSDLVYTALRADITTTATKIAA